jgi:hypothetical protein
MAKQPSKRVQDFLKELATNSELLGEVIKNPEAEMKKRNISEKDRMFIRKSLALEASKKLMIVPDAFFIHW